MTLTTKNLLLLERKVKRLDCQFLQERKYRLSYRNPYFLVCVNEVICRFLNNNTLSEENLGINNLMDVLNRAAEKLYLNSNISDSFDEEHK